MVVLSNRKTKLFVVVAYLLCLAIIRVILNWNASLRQSWNYLNTFVSNTTFPINEAVLDIYRDNQVTIVPLKSTTVGSKGEETLNIWEQPTLLNLTNFVWIINNENLCALDSNSSSTATRVMPVLVHSQRSHFSQRSAIRKSWGSVPIYRNWDVRFVFLLGESNVESVSDKQKVIDEENMLKREQAAFGDVVIGSFVESYRNLTYKHLMGYKWILNFCAEAKFILKIDDDMFIDILRWIDWWSNDLEKSEQIPDLICRLFRNNTPIRENQSKLYVSRDDWTEDYYPDFCSGWAYSISTELIKKIYYVSNDATLFWIDDVFVTGVLLEVVKKKFEWKPLVRNIFANATNDIMGYRSICEHEYWEFIEGARMVLAHISPGELFQNDMMCLWNITLRFHDIFLYNLTFGQFSEVV